MISIIVPVYNGEDHLEQCICSILAQTHVQLQLILVNDGSVDATGQICDAYAEKDSRVTVIHQKNAGVSAARNAGLDAATGEYIGFVDADDTIPADTYEQALKAMGDCGIVMWDTVTVWSDGRREPDTIDMLNADTVLEKKDWTPELLRWMAGSACRCLYRAELLSDVRFPVGIKLSEDRLFNLQAMGKAQRLCYLKRGLYHRYVRQGSACNSYHSDRFQQYLQANELAQAYVSRYWDPDWGYVYTRTFVIGGAMEAIYQTYGKNSPYKGMKQRLNRIRTIAGEPALRAAFEICAPQGLRQKLLYNKCCGLLGVAAWLWNVKNR